MTEYRKREGKDTWHFCSNCSNWPTGAGVKKQVAKPTTGELCDQCKAKKRNKNCK